MTAERELTPKQRAFVAAYLANGMNGALAYRTAYNPNASSARSAEEACKLLKHSKIGPMVAQAHAKAEKASARAVERFAITRATLARHTALMAHFDIRGAFKLYRDRVEVRPFDDMPEDIVAALTAIEMRTDGTIKLSFVDKRQATVDLARLNGWITERRETRTITSLQDLSDDELNAVEASITQGRGRR